MKTKSEFEIWSQDKEGKTALIYAVTYNGFMVKPLQNKQLFIKKIEKQYQKMFYERFYLLMKWMKPRKLNDMRTNCIIISAMELTRKHNGKRRNGSHASAKWCIHQNKGEDNT